VTIRLFYGFWSIRKPLVVRNLKLECKKLLNRPSAPMGGGWFCDLISVYLIPLSGAERPCADKDKLVNFAISHSLRVRSRAAPLGP